MTYTQVWDAMANAPSETMIRRDHDQAHIPFDDGNRDYQEYKAWLAEGNAPAEVERPPSPGEPPPNPQDVVADVYNRLDDLEERLSEVEKNR